MAVQLFLIAPGMNEALREARFDDAGPVETRAEPLCVGPRARVVCSPSGRCRATAAAFGLERYEEVPALAGCAMGRWRGRRLDEVAAAEPEAVAAWLGDPGSAPHGGESLRQVRARVAEWMDALAANDPGARVWAVVEPDVIRAAIAHALGAPEEVFWRLDVRPASRVSLTGRAGRWNLQLDTQVA
ncbi:histidine phosphatase family protein [Streptomyces sp. NPDC048718]|uniref:histidine phosphatase family protein n=1 Tax=Streptomyces sp. NPDC048718 TaxID=3365587 RepID=UPI003723A179